MEKITHQMRLQQWSKIIAECLASGQNKTAWCRQNGISDKKFFYWQKILRREAYALSETARDGAIVSNTSQMPTVPFVELKLEQGSSDKSVSAGFKPDVIIQANGMIVALSNSASPDLLNTIGGILNAK